MAEQLLTSDLSSSSAISSWGINWSQIFLILDHWYKKVLLRVHASTLWQTCFFDIFVSTSYSSIIGCTVWNPMTNSPSCMCLTHFELLDFKFRIYEFSKVWPYIGVPEFRWFYSLHWWEFKLFIIFLIANIWSSL